MRGEAERAPAARSQLRVRSFACAASLVLAFGLTACSKEEPAQPATVTHVAPDALPALHVPSVPRPALPETPCNLARIEWRDRTEPALLVGDTGTAWLDAAAADHFPRTDAGWTLFLELAAVASDLHEGKVHIGVRGFLKDPSRLPPPVLEAVDAALEPLPEVCSAGFAQAGCAEALWRDALAASVGEVARQLRFQCDVRHLDGAGLAAAFAGAEPWQQAVLATAAGELGDPASVPALLALLDDADPPIRLRAVAALGRLQAADAVSPLVRLTQGADEPLLRAVVVALSDIGTADARRYLATWAEHHPLTEIRELAAELLGQGPPP